MLDFCGCIASLGYVALTSLLLGCTGLNPSYADGADGETEGSPGSTTRNTSGSDPRPTDPSDPTTQPTTSTSQSTLEPTDGPGGSTTGGPETSETGSGEESGGVSAGVVPGECSTYDQDCPADQKCMPFSNDGGAWNELGCFPLNPVHQVGDECSVEESATSGVDNCDATSMCWDVDTKTNQGICAAFCGGTQDNPTCENQGDTCVQNNEGVISLCLSACDPLLQDCGGTSTCVPAAEGFACVPDASGADGQPGDPCSYVNACDPGSFCASADISGACDVGLCCTSYCALDEEDICGGPSVCVPYYPKGLAPPDLENVGFCGVE